MGRIGVEEADRYQPQSNSDWFSLPNDKDIARVQFMCDKYEDLEVYACHRVKVGEKERYVDCLRAYDEPIDKCPFCAEGYPVKPVRFVIMFQHDDQKVKIWERGKNFISKLQGLFNRYSPLSSYVFEIERNGKKGDKETKYEIFPMDRVEPFDLSEIEYPELLGGIILSKDAEEMEHFLQTGDFPKDEDGAETAPQPRAANRRAPVDSSPQPARREAASTPQPDTQRGPSRRSREAF